MRRHNAWKPGLHSRRVRPATELNEVGVKVIAVGPGGGTIDRNNRRDDLGVSKAAATARA
jgi:hypothetical protein